MELWLGEGFALLGFLRPTSAPLGATTIPSGMRVPTSFPPVWLVLGMGLGLGLGLGQG